MIAYNANAAGNYPLAYVGQDLYLSGFRMGQRIAEKVTSGDILVGISQPGGNNVQPGWTASSTRSSGGARRARSSR